MDIQQKKQQIEQEYQKNQKLIEQLLARQQQLRGQYQLLLDIEKENKEKEEKSQKKKESK